MSRKITLILVVSMLFTAPVFAQYDTEEAADDFEYDDFEYYDESSRVEIPQTIRNNSFFRESIRLTRLAQETFEYGDYDASTGFAEEAIRYTQLSNKFIADQLIGEAGRRLDWANSNNIAGAFPYDYNEAKRYYEISVISQANADWEEAIDAAVKSIDIFTILEGGGGGLPGQYTVRTWAVYRDCLWNIAGYSWVYGDPYKWTLLYEANRSAMPDPNNPDLIVPGMILQIPSIRGESRRGMWDPNRSY